MANDQNAINQLNGQIANLRQTLSSEENEIAAQKQIVADKTKEFEQNNLALRKQMEDQVNQTRTSMTQTYQAEKSQLQNQIKELETKLQSMSVQAQQGMQNLQKTSDSLNS